MADLSMSGHSEGAVLFLLAVAFIAGLARGFSGFGAALIFMPLASSIIGPRSIAPLLLIIAAVAALGLLPRGWLLADRPSIGTMTLGALVGVPLGTYALTRMDPLALRWGIVALVVLLLGLLMSGWRYHGRPATPLTVGVGGLAGFFSGAAQVGGPPVVAYWLGGGGNGECRARQHHLVFRPVERADRRELPGRWADHAARSWPGAGDEPVLWTWPLSRLAPVRTHQ